MSFDSILLRLQNAETNLNTTMQRNNALINEVILTENEHSGHLDNIANDVASIDAKVSTEAQQILQLDQETVTATNTTSIDSKITVGSDDQLTEAQQVLVYGRKDATPSGLRAIKTDFEGRCIVKNEAITSGSDFTLAEAQQVLVYGEVTSGAGAGELHPIHITNSGDVEVEIADFKKGQELMVDSFPVVIASDQSVLSVTDTATTSIDSKITVGEDDTLTSAQQILIYGRKDSSPTGLSAVKVAGDGSLHVSTARNGFTKSTEFLVLPPNGTANSTPVNTLDKDGFGICATSTNTTDPIELYASNDNLTFYPTNVTGGSGNFYHEIYHPSFNYYKIIQTDTTTTAGTVNVICSKR